MRDKAKSESSLVADESKDKPESSIKETVKDQAEPLKDEDKGVAEVEPKGESLSFMTYIFLFIKLPSFQNRKTSQNLMLKINKRVNQLSQ